MKKINGENILLRKSHGIFYTPNYIAKYIVNNSIGILISNLYYELNSVNNIQKLKICLEKAKKLKFLDPACGDGVFLLEMFKIMREFYESYNEKFVSLIRNRFVSKNSPEEKIHNPGLFAIFNNIYGVDKDQNAIKEVCTKLKSELKEEMNIDISILKDLNIKVGNSLIFPHNCRNDESTQKEIEKILQFRSKLKDFEHPIKHSHILKKEIKRVQDLLNSHYNSSLNKFFNLRDWKYKPFNWSLEFPEVFSNNGGFDVVLGNPPYIRVHKQEPALKKYLKAVYFTPKMDFDIYICFIELALTLLKRNGILSFIVPDKFLVREYAENLRYLLLNNTNFIELLDISRCNTFKASTYPIIFTLKKIEDPLIKENRIIRFHKNEFDIYQIRGKINKKIKESPKIFHKKINQLKFTKTPKSRIYINIDEIYDIIETKLDPLPKLSDFIKKTNIFCGTPRAKHYHSWKNYVSDKKPKNGEFLKYIVCRNVFPFYINWGISINSFRKSYNTPYFKFQRSAMPDQKWKNFQITPKILIRGNDTRLTAAIDDEGYVFVGIYAIIQNQYDPRYLVGLLNSNLINAYFFHKNPSIKVRGGYFSINSSHLLNLPIYPALEKDMNYISNNVSKIIEINDKNTRISEVNKIEEFSQIDSLLEELNNKIYQIYRLNNEEIEKIKTFVSECKIRKKLL
ncbi:MAG: Eco57I restriction-modification methylase domain-containing protein [Promethearchaeota archaeon]